MRYLVILALAGTLSACAPPNGKDKPMAATLKTEPCRVIGFDIGMECATLSVPENRETAGGRKIDIQVAILRAKADRKKPDPIFVFAGGPGQSAVQVGALTMPALGRLNRDRDIVFVDQRGTGDSNGMTCELGDDGNLQGFNEPSQVTSFIKDCLAEVRKHADPEYYTTTIAMQDIDEIRAGLGYAKINLWGASYGTRAEMEYLRRYPGNVRSAVLDGMAPAGMMLPLSFVTDGNAAINSLLEACAKSPACAKEHPKLEADLRKLLKDLAAKPRKLDIAHPRTGEKTPMTVTPTVVLGGIRAAMYSANFASVVPVAITAALKDDYSALAALSFSIGGSVSDQLALGMHLSVICAEDAPLVDAATGQQKWDDKDFYGKETIADHARMCAIWPRGKVTKDFYDPVKTDVPVLLLSGGIDPATPPRHAEAVLKGLSRGKHLVAPNLGHGVSMQGCAPDLVKRFIEDGNADKVDGACLNKIPRPTFFQALTGSAS
jgi:pimeloyl-ACP methyl ester carboxylesterase